MITFTQGYTRAADIVGISLTQNSQDLTNIKQDWNQGLRLFRNAARRYNTRAEKKTDIVANQQYYQMPPDFVRVTQIRVNMSGLNIPLEEVDSEKRWNRLNIIPNGTVNVPTHFFVKGNNEIGLWPIPATAATGGLIVSYEPRLPDMTQDDVTSTSNSYTTAHAGTNVTATINNGSTALVLSQAIGTQQMVGQWFQFTDANGDGYWYQITGYTDATHLTLGQDYAGNSVTNGLFIIGFAPDIPEDYHLAPVYYAAYQFFLKRKDNNQSQQYFGLFNDLLTQFKETYAAKSTGQVQNDTSDFIYNIFGVPPQNITG